MWIRRLSELALAGSLALSAADAGADPPGAAPDDALAAYREQFKRGMDLYEHGDAAEAVAIWEPVYRDLGEQRGYRLAYDLGIAYAALDDAPRSGERLQAFVSEVDSRRGRGEALGAAVTKEESDARARLARLATSLGRVQVVPGSSPSVARVDAGIPHAAGFIAWVAPGQHAVTFDPGTRDERTIPIDVAPGALVELVPPPPGPAIPASGAARDTGSRTAPAGHGFGPVGPGLRPPADDCRGAPAPTLRPVLAVADRGRRRRDARRRRRGGRARAPRELPARSRRGRAGALPRRDDRPRRSRVVHHRPDVGLRVGRRRGRPRRTDRRDRRLVSPRQGARRSLAAESADRDPAPALWRGARRHLLKRAGVHLPILPSFLSSPLLSSGGFAAWRLPLSSSRIVTVSDR